MNQPKTSLAFLLVILVVLAYLFLNSSYFTAAALQWTGLVLLDGAQLDDFVDFQPTNVLYLDKGALQRRLEEHPWIEKATVRWTWPNHVEVMISERLPLAWVAYGDIIYVLDRSGALMAPPSQFSVLELPKVVNVDLTAQAQLKAAARVLAAVPPGMVGTFARWDGASRALVTKSGVEIIMGDMEDVEAKLLLLEELWQDLAAQGLDPAVIDLRVLKNPVVRLRQP
ncbi:MAG TPA: FtsQ-type POTRA domain-containing protein [Firmicutes bacterium]|nr:FtsQ-type POTRA domain-containing protein [Bacillota bacterium]